ncbi:hypothetical protein VNO80_09942 [Phaseolus coccineus]|uniref:Uncharacterized protein n=1 Tax=Phaseolus coccineus TaxID=3886 RepID=A0AAN9RDC4_PHACN
MTEFVVECVLHNLNSLIQKEFTPFLSFHEDLRKIASLFTTIKDSLEDAEEKRFSNRDINNWLLKINDVARTVDDIIDECVYEALELEYQGVKGDLSNKVQRSCLSSFDLNHVVFGYKMAKKMKRISERLVEIVVEKNKFHLTETLTETEMIVGRRNEVIEGRRTTFFFCEPEDYGRQQDKYKLIHHLTGDPYVLRDDLLVSTILGPEGIGKTTFAKLIFDYPRIVNYFELRIWVSGVSDFSLKGMIEAIIKAVIGCDCEDLDLELLQKKLQYLLRRKRYLIVLDFKLYPEHQSRHTFRGDTFRGDTFPDDWKRLKSVLACGKDGASILVTAPSRSIAAGIMGTEPHFELSEISENDCWALFRQQVLKYHSLRVLELRLRGELSPSIRNLKHLRYLNLSKSDFKTLPEYLCKLWNLQILKLDYCKHLQKLPKSLVDLKSLLKLSFKGCHKLSSLPPHMGKLTSLRSLTSYFVGHEKWFLLAELGGMKLKGDLEIKHLERVKSVDDVMKANMSSKRLNELKLSWDKNENTKFRENVEEILKVLQPDTQQLIERWRELKGLHEALQAMTALQSSRLYDLPNLESLPDCFQHLRSLRQLAIGFCCKLTSFPRSLRLNMLERFDIYACPALEKQLHYSLRVLRCEIRVDGCLITKGKHVTISYHMFYKLITISYRMLYEVYQVFLVGRSSSNVKC